MRSHPKIQPAAAAIGLGSNLGESPQILAGAIAALDAHPEIAVVARSAWYRTAPIGPPQPDYLNGCALLHTSLAPESLLAALLAIELQFGRERRQRWGPRTLDLDLLLYDGAIVETPTLQIPHPRLQERAFVLVPLAEIAPDWRHPRSDRCIRALRDKLDCSGVRRIESA